MKGRGTDDALRDLADEPPLAKAKSSGTSFGSWRPSVEWTIIYLINLALPLSLGWGCTIRAGRIGMCMAIAAIFLATACFFSRSRRVEHAMIVGGGLVALSRFLARLHVLSGSIALGLTKRVGWISPGEFGDVNCEAGGFLATALTGGMLMTVSLLLGLVVVAFLDVLTT